MDDIVFEILKCVVMVAALIVARYFVPWIKSVIETNNLSVVVEWVSSAVLMAQQVYTGAKGSDKKETVVKFLKSVLAEKNITITDEQLDTLIEAAVKEMKLQECNSEDSGNEDTATE